MKKNLLVQLVIVFCFTLAACGGGKYSKATEGAEKDAAKAALDKWENEMEAKYKGDEAFMKEVEKEVEKCEDASEGR